MYGSWREGHSYRYSDTILPLFIQKTMCIAQNMYYFMQYMVADALCDQYL